jgi:hypothetical protein
MRLSGSYPRTMQIDLTAEQEARLSQIAAQNGKGADELAREVLLRGLDVEATVIASRSRNIQGQEAVARILELRRDNILPANITIQDLINEGRA